MSKVKTKRKSKRKMKSKSKNQSTQSDESSGEKVSVKEDEGMKEFRKADAKDVITTEEAFADNQVTLIKDLGFDPQALTGNMSRAWNFVKSSELDSVNTRRRKTVSGSKLRRMVKRIARELDGVDKLEGRTGKVNTLTSSATTTTPTFNSNFSKPLSWIPVNAQDTIVTTAPDYTQTKDEYNVFNSSLDSLIPLLVKGPKGIGKTLAIAAWCAKNRFGMRQYDCSEGTKKQDLVGTWTMWTDPATGAKSTPFKLGVIPEAIEMANQLGMFVLVLEELNALPPAMQKLLNPLLDWRNGMYIQEVSHLFQLKKNAKLLVLATTNPSSYSASNDLNEDLKSRFKIWNWRYPTAKQEKKIIDWKTMNADMQKALVGFTKETRRMVDRDEISYAISTRDLDKIVRDYHSNLKVFKNEQLSLKMTLETCVLGYYDDKDHLDAIKSRLESSFGSKVFAGEEIGTVADVTEDNDGY